MKIKESESNNSTPIIYLTPEKLKQLKPFIIRNNSNSGREGTFYLYNTSEEIKLLKIIPKIYLENSKLIPEYETKINNIEILTKYNKIISQSISELVLPEEIVSLEGYFGHSMKLISGTSLNNYLQNTSIPLNQKINILKKIGLIIEKTKNINNFPYSIHLGDLHEDNILIDTSGNIKIIDATGLYIKNNGVIPTKYLKPNLSKYSPGKYQTERGMIIPTTNTDIFCYSMIIMNFICKHKIGFYGLYINLREDYLNYLDKLGYSQDFINCIKTLYNPNPNINPYKYLETITEDKLKQSDIRIYTRKKH